MRTKILLHLVDIAAPDGEDPVKAVKSITKELAKFSEDLLAKERWLVINKLDLLSKEEAEKRCKNLKSKLKWKGPVYKISAIQKQGTQEICYALMEYLEAQTDK